MRFRFQEKVVIDKIIIVSLLSNKIIKVCHFITNYRDVTVPHRKICHFPYGIFQFQKFYHLLPLQSKSRKFTHTHNYHYLWIIYDYFLRLHDFK